MGRLNDREVKLMIDDRIEPVAQKPRKTPYNLQAKVDQKLTDLLQHDIIEKVPEDVTRTWISPTVVALRPQDPNRIRFCVDMRRANEAISRPNTVIPTVDELIHQMNGAVTFSKLDLSEAFHPGLCTAINASISAPRPRRTFFMKRCVTS